MTLCSEYLSMSPSFHHHSNTWQKRPAVGTTTAMMGQTWAECVDPVMVSQSFWCERPFAICNLYHLTYLKMQTYVSINTFAYLWNTETPPSTSLTRARLSQTGQDAIPLVYLCILTSKGEGSTTTPTNQEALPGGGRASADKQWYALISLSAGSIA